MSYRIFDNVAQRTLPQVYTHADAAETAVFELEGDRVEGAKTFNGPRYEVRKIEEAK